VLIAVFIDAAMASAVSELLADHDTGALRMLIPSTVTSSIEEDEAAAPPPIVTRLPTVTSPPTVTTIALPFAAVPVAVAVIVTVWPFAVAV
jgi:hypothetical protein